MLQSLHIRNVALIEEMTLSFGKGLSVMTGETGAGKSILLEALGFVLGGRSDRTLIRTGAEKAAVEALFAPETAEPVWEVLRALELSDGYEEELSLYREMSVSGRSTCRINGVPVTAAQLRTVGDSLVNIHGQHEHETLLSSKRHGEMLDRFAGAQPLLQEVALRYREAADLKKRLTEVQTDERERARLTDLYAWQAEELDKANLQPGEEEALREQRKLLQNAQHVMDALSEASEDLNGERGALEPLCSAMDAMERIAPLHADYREASRQITDCYYTLEDLGRTLQDLRDAFRYDPEELDGIEDRLQLIRSMERKYGATVEEVLAYRERIREELKHLTRGEEEKAELQQAYAGALKAYGEAASRLTSLRTSAAERLREALLPELRDLSMPGASFRVEFTPLDGELPGSKGAEEAAFFLSANRGEPLKPLSAVASGGELSRIMLGFKTVLAGTEDISTMIFDEIDTGISGGAGNALGEKLRALAKDRQVLCVTHLAQIAALADTHYYVSKREEGGKTFSAVRQLTAAERPGELVRIMGGAQTDREALSHAEAMLRR